MYHMYAWTPCCCRTAKPTAQKERNFKSREPGLQKIGPKRRVKFRGASGGKGKGKGICRRAMAM